RLARATTSNSKSQVPQNRSSKDDALDRSARLADHARAGLGGDPMDVGGWLRSLGLEQYEAAFRENNVDGSILPSLTTEDLKELGVGSVGHRRKLLDAIARMRTEPGVPTPPSEAPLVTAKDTAERRQVTVMFSDLVGSTALSVRMDPE